MQPPNPSTYTRYHHPIDRFRIPIRKFDMKLMTIADVANYLATSKSLVYQLVELGELPYIQVGKAKCYRFDPEDITEFIRRRKVRNEGRKPKVSRPRLKHIKV